MKPLWPNLTSPDLPRAWVARLGWVDPLTLSQKVVLPFTDQLDALFAACAGGLALRGGTVLPGGSIAASLTEKRRLDGSRHLMEQATPAQCRSEPSDAMGLVVLWSSTLLGGILGPTHWGPGHGEDLPQRLVLLGLVAMVPAFDIPLATRWGRLAAGCLAAAVGLQTVIVWDYASHCKHTAVQIIKASELVGRDQRIARLLIGIRSRFRANPRLHADSWLGVGTGNILWKQRRGPLLLLSGAVGRAWIVLIPRLCGEPQFDRTRGTCVRLWSSSLQARARSTGSWLGRAIPCSMRSPGDGRTSWPSVAMYGSSRCVVRVRQARLPRSPDGEEP